MYAIFTQTTGPRQQHSLVFYHMLSQSINPDEEVSSPPECPRALNENQIGSTQVPYGSKLYKLQVALLATWITQKFIVTRFYLQEGQPLEPMHFPRFHTTCSRIFPWPE